MARFENEEWGISSIEKQISVFKADFGTFSIQTCYDIEFPIGSHLMAANGVQMILAPSCTVTIREATRVHIGARARAMEQQIYVGVAQTIGNSEWLPAVDINYGFKGIYASPDKNRHKEDQVFNYKDAQGQFITLND